MIKFNPNAETKTYLLNSSPEEIYKWFEKNSDTEWNYETIKNEDPNILEDNIFFDTLIRKNNNLVKLALAKFTTELDLLKNSR